MSSPTGMDDRPLDGLVVAITGATAGLGYFTAEQLVAAGASVILLARDASRAHDAILALRTVTTDADVWHIPLDLADLSSIADAAQQLRALPDLHVLINNAGVLSSPRPQLTRDGHELIFGTNYLGHVALTSALLESLEENPGSRVVHLGSITHEFVALDFDDLQNTRYASFRAYSRSKLAVMMFGFELDTRLRERGYTTRSLVAHPGWAVDELTPVRAGVSAPVRVPGPLRAGLRLIAQGKDRGAQPTVAAATRPTARGGDYWGPDGWHQLKGAPTVVRTKPHARDRMSANRLWQATDELLGESFWGG